MQQPVALQGNLQGQFSHEYVGKGLKVLLWFFFVCVFFSPNGCSQGLEANFILPHGSQSCLYAPGTAVDKLERCAMFGNAVAGLSFSFSFSSVTKEEDDRGSLPSSLSTSSLQTFSRI